MVTELELETTAMAYGGDAIARHEHRLLFVPYALPNERVRVTLIEEHKRWARTELQEILRPSPERITPTCPHFGPGRCGGCQWQHANVRSQMAYKQRLLQDQMAQVEGFFPQRIRPTGAVAQPWAYQSRAVYYATGAGALGLPQRHSQQMHAIDHCPLQHPALAGLYSQFNLEWDGLQSVDLSVGISSGQSLVVLRTRRDEVPEIETDLPVAIALQRSRGTIQPLIGEPWIYELIRGHEYRLSAGSPRPAHIAATEAVLEQVAVYLEPAPGQVMVDVYCGVGLMTLAFAEQVSVMIGIEEDAIAMEDCAFNCQHLDNVTLSEGPPPQVLRLHKGYADIAVVSPPAAGMGHRLAQNLARMGVKRVAYVAPHPNTLLRDLPAWQQGHYILDEITPIDSGPQTAGLIAVALFRR